MLKPSEMRVVIASRRRSEVCQHIAALVPRATIYVAEEEAEDYAWAGKRLVTHPDRITGIGPVRCAMLRTFKEKCIVSLDDDVRRVWSLVGRRSRKITDPEAIWMILFQAAVVTQELGISCFSFATTPNILDFVPHDPIGLTKALGPCLGFVGRNIIPDESMDHQTDTDLSLQCCMKDRFVWQDCRFAFEHSFQSNAGGGTHKLSAADFEKYLKILERKWGSKGLYWDAVESAGKLRTIIRVRRRQTIEL